DITAAGDWRSPGIRGAQRWIALQLQSAGTVSIDYVRVREEHLRPSVGDYTGHFLSSDDRLNRVWYAGVYTFALDSFKDLRPDHPPPAGSPRPAAQNFVGQGMLPEYTAWWVIAVHDYDLFTGDDGFARRMLPVARRALAYFTGNLDANGLYRTPNGPPVVYIN